MNDEIERTLCQLPQVHVFKIPPRTSAQGYRAADWPTVPQWTGKIRISAKGNLCVITLLDNENKIFAQCPVTDDAAVERTLDSGRYFILRIQNATGQKAYIGIAFNERNDAFDFNVALADFKQEVERDKAAASGDVQKTIVPLRDLSLKDGEKIKIQIGDGQKKEKKVSTSSSSGGLLAPPPGDRKGLLAPPPADKSLKPVPVANTTTSDPFGDFTSSSSSSSSTTTSDPFGSFSSFTSSQPASSAFPSSFSDPFQPSTSTSADPFSVFNAPKPTTASSNNNNTTTNLLDF